MAYCICSVSHWNLNFFCFFEKVVKTVIWVYSELSGHIFLYLIDTSYLNHKHEQELFYFLKTDMRKGNFWCSH
jgi:hypothetical protein